MIVPTRVLFEHAYGKYALGAYNINNLEQAMGLFKGCIDSQAPFIIQISKGARSYTDKRMLEAMIRAAGPPVVVETPDEGLRADIEFVRAALKRK